ncbi:MAG TPA: hypothetical protein VGE07_04815 [Herpetosiphonaceae bacterium]
MEIPSTLDQFEFRQERLPIGSAFHYRKSNLDGSSPAAVSMYLSDGETLEVLKVEAHGVDAPLIRARLDWERFGADRLRSWLVTGDGVRRQMAEFSAEAEVIKVHLPMAGRNERVPIAHLPFHVYNFDLLSLVLMVPHLARPDEPFSVGLYQPGFSPRAKSALEYLGLAEFDPAGEVEDEGVVCRRYAVGGPAFGGKTGQLWAERDTGLVRWIAIPVPDHPDWDSFMLTFERQERLGRAQWDAFVAETIGGLSGRAE